VVDRGIIISLFIASSDRMVNDPADRCRHRAETYSSKVFRGIKRFKRGESSLKT